MPSIFALLNFLHALVSSALSLVSSALSLVWLAVLVVVFLVVEPNTALLRRRARSNASATEGVAGKVT